MADLVGWSSKLKPLMRITDNADQYAAFLNVDDAALSASLVRFLKSIDKSGNDDLNFAVKLDEGGVLTINNIDTNQLVLELLTELGPLLNPNASGQIAPAPALQ